MFPQTVWKFFSAFYFLEKVPKQQSGSYFDTKTLSSYYPASSNLLLTDVSAKCLLETEMETVLFEICEI